MIKVQKQVHNACPVSIQKPVDPGFELHTFDNLVDLEGNPISVKVTNEQKANFEAAGEAGRRAAQSFKKLFP